MLVQNHESRLPPRRKEERFSEFFRSERTDNTNYDNECKKVLAHTKSRSVGMES